MLKKWTSLALAVVLGASVFAGCGAKTDDTTTSAETSTEAEKADDQAATEDANAEGAVESAVAQEGASGDEIVIGAMGPLTGAASQYGIAALNGVKLYIDEVNAAGGIDGKQIKLLIEDEKGDEAEAVNVYEKLMGQGVVAIIGDVTSKPSMAVAARAAQDGIPMISPTGTAAEITEAGDNIFRVCFLDPYQSQVLATYAAEDLSAKTAAVLYDVSNDYSVGLKEAFEEKAKELGIEIIATESYNTGDVDFKSQLTTIMAKNPDVLFLPDYYQTVVLIAAQMQEMDFKTTTLGGDGWDGVLEATEDHASLEGAVFSNHYVPTDAKVLEFAVKYKEAYGLEPNSFATLGYDAAKAMVEAIKTAGSTDSAAIVAALKATTIDGLTGTISFDENGNPIKVAHILVIKDGKYEFVKDITVA